MASSLIADSSVAHPHPTIPSAAALFHAAKVALEQDRPIYLDYYRDSVTKKCCIGVHEDNSRFLVKSAQEYTSPIESIIRLKEEYTWLVLTENSLYIVASTIPVKKIVSSGGGGSSS